MTGRKFGLRPEGLDVLLFEKDGDTPYLIYHGQFVCSSYDIEKQPDRLGAERDAIVFNLIPIGAEDAAPPTPPDPNATLAELRKRAYSAAGPARKKGSTGTRTVYERSADVKAYVLARASGTCEGCFKAAPFTTKAGMPYLEPHHIDRLSDGGPDDPRRVAATCPNCHKRAHFADNAKAFNDELRKRITKLEAQASKSANN